MNATAPLFEPITSGEARTWTPPQGRADIAPSRYERIVLGCAGVDSYIYLERCVATLTEAGVQKE